MRTSNKIDIGIVVRRDVFMETRMVIEADSGAGKSWAIRKMAEENSGKVQQIIIDPEADFITLREKYPFALVAKSGGDIPLNIRYAEALAHKLLETGISVIIDLYEFKQHEREQFIKAFFEALIDAPKKIRHACIIYLDEAQLFCPEDKRAISTHAVIDMATRGRKRGLCLVLATLRISILNKSAAAQCKNKMMGSTSLPLDQKRVGEELGLTSKEDVRNLRNLNAGEFYAFGPAISKEIVKFKVGQVKTTHVKSGTKLKSLPPTPNAIKKILSQLKGIPEEAEKEITTKKDLNQEITRLRLELKKQKPTIVEKVIEKPRDQKLKNKYDSVIEDNRKLLALNKDLIKGRENMLKGISSLLVDYGKKVTLPKLKGPSLPLPKDYLAVSNISTIDKLGKVSPLKFDKGELKVPANSATRVFMDKSKQNKDFDGKSLPVGEMKVLTACAQFPNGLRRDQITVITGYKRSTRDRYIQFLKEKGMLDQDGERLIPSEGGIAYLGEDFEQLPTGEELRQYWLSKLPTGEKAILQSLIMVYPEAMSRDAISEATGYKRSTRDRYLQFMASKEIVVAVGREGVKASDNLF